MKRDYKLFLQDIKECIIKIERYLGDISEEQFYLNEELQDAVIRRLEIIGEATKNISESIRKKYLDIEWKKIAGIRDIIIHAYFELDLDLIWDLIRNKLSILKKKIKSILDEEHKGK